jgi:hypothetical protein
LNDQHFDKWQFANRRSNPISAASDGHGGFTTPGITFEDYSRMASMFRKTTGERRLPTPSWAIDDRKLRHLLVVFMELRAGLVCFKKPLVEKKQDLTPEALKVRLEKAKQKLLSRRDGKQALMKRLNEEYVELRQLGLGAEPRCRQLEIEIVGLDTYLRTSENGTVDVIAAMVYLYYRAAQDSVGVSSELGVKPQHVRQTLWRLHRAADFIAGVKRVPPTKEEREARKLARAATLRLEAEARAGRAEERAANARAREIERIAAEQRREERRDFTKELKAKVMYGVTKATKTRWPNLRPSPVPVPVVLKKVPRWLEAAASAV